MTWQDLMKFEGEWDNGYQLKGVLTLPNKTTFDGQWIHGLSFIKKNMVFGKVQGYGIEYDQHGNKIREGYWISDESADNGYRLLF